MTNRGANRGHCSFFSVDLPPGLNIDSSSGVISGTVDYTAAEYFNGVYNTTVIVANGHGGAASVTFAWTIADTPRDPDRRPEHGRR